MHRASSIGPGDLDDDNVNAPDADTGTARFTCSDNMACPLCTNVRSSTVLRTNWVNRCISIRPTVTVDWFNGGGHTDARPGVNAITGRPRA